MKMNVKNEVKAKVKVESSGRMHYNSQVRCGDDTERRNEGEHGKMENLAMLSGD